MRIEVRPYNENDLPVMIEIWNEVVEEGEAFPQEDHLTLQTGKDFFASQTHSAVAVDTDTGEVLGLYILHPNNIGRCGHIGNASYAVSAEYRGMHIGEALVRDSLKVAKEYGFRLIQFNAVVAENKAAIALYEKIGFVRLGTVPGGFLLKDGRYSDIILYYYEL